MIRPAMLRRHAARSEEGEAAERAVILVTLAVGAMLTILDATHELPLLVAAATLALVLAMGLRADRIVPWAAAAVWASILPRTEGWGTVAPLMMIALCLALAIGPGQVLDWLRDEWSGRASAEPAAGWIEED
jgi:hypothetical protein